MPVETLYVLNVGHKDVTGEYGGAKYTFPSGKILVVSPSENHKSLQVPRKIVDHIFAKLPQAPIVLYDFEQRAAVGVEKYNRDKKIEGYTRLIDGVDKMLEDHAKANDERTQHKLNAMGLTLPLRKLRDERRVYATALAGLGEEVEAEPSINLPGDFDSETVAPKPTRVFHGSGVIDPDMEQPVDTMPRRRGRPPKSEAKGA